MYAGQPKKPSNGAGSKIQCLESMKTMVVLTWSPPENYDRTTIDYYELTLIGKHPNTATRVYVGADPQQPLSHILQVDSERNYTSASILAVDVCGQRSESSLFAINSIPIMTDTPNSNHTIQAGHLGVIILIVFALLVLHKIICH